MKNNRLSLFISDFYLVIHYFTDAFQYIRKHKLWTGMFEAKWFANLIIGVGILMYLQLYWIAKRVFISSDENQEVAIASINKLGNFFTETYDFLFVGAFKYIVLILLEIFIFHFIRKTIEELSGLREEASFSAFMNALKRMVKITIRNFILETIFSWIAIAVLALLGISFMKIVVVFIIQAYFLGFTLIDNYHEIRNLDIKKSEELTRNYPGVAIGIGTGFTVLLAIPILGLVLAPVIAGVTAARTMYDLQMDDTV